MIDQVGVGRAASYGLYIRAAAPPGCPGCRATISRQFPTPLECQRPKTGFPQEAFPDILPEIRRLVATYGLHIRAAAPPGRPGCTAAILRRTRPSKSQEQPSKAQQFPIPPRCTGLASNARPLYPHSSTSRSDRLQGFDFEPIDMPSVREKAKKWLPVSSCFLKFRSRQTPTAT